MNSTNCQLRAIGHKRFLVHFSLFFSFENGKIERFMLWKCKFNAAFHNRSHSFIANKFFFVLTADNSGLWNAWNIVPRYKCVFLYCFWDVIYLVIVIREQERRTQSISFERAFVLCAMAWLAWLRHGHTLLFCLCDFCECFEMKRTTRYARISIASDFRSKSIWT